MLAAFKAEPEFIDLGVMAAQQQSSERLKQLLDRLDTKPDAAPMTLQGRATSRSDSSLHLCIASGIVAIPLNEIEDVSSLSIKDPKLVAVFVKDATKIRHLLRTTPIATETHEDGIRIVLLFAIQVRSSRGVDCLGTPFMLGIVAFPPKSDPERR